MISVKPYMNLYAAASAYCSASVTLWAHSACSGIKTSPSLIKCCYFGLYYLLSRHSPCHAPSATKNENRVHRGY